MLSVDVAQSVTSPAVRHAEGVCGGAACIRETRIPVWLLVQSKRLGRDEAGLLEDYPGLTHDDLNAAWAYDRQHAAEIDDAIAEQERDDV